MEKTILSISLTIFLIVLAILPGCSGNSLALVPKSEFDKCDDLRINLIDETESLDIQISEKETQLDDLEVQKLTFNSTLEAKDARMIELEEELYTVKMEKGLFASIEMTIIPDVMSLEYIEDIIDEEGRIQGEMIIEELNGVGSKITEFHSVIYDANDDILVEWYTDIPSMFKPNGKFLPLGFHAGFYRLYFRSEYKYVIYTLKGIDDNGNEFEKSCRFDFLEGG